MPGRSNLAIPAVSASFIDSAGERVKLGGGALTAMARYVQVDPTKREAGGVLLGRFLLGNNDVVVDTVTVPHRGDKRKRLHFFRSAAAHQSELDRAWSESGGTTNYLGEWHTHPEADPKPSQHDMDGWGRRLRFAEFDSEFLFFVIVGICGFCVWKGRRENGSLEKLSPIAIKQA